MEEKDSRLGIGQDNDQKIIRIFTMPLQYPCGPGAECCGPVGQSEEEVQKLKEAIERELDATVEVRNVANGNDMRDFRPISGLVRTFGTSALPFITLGDDVVSMGSPAPQEAVAALREKMQEYRIR